MRAAVIPLLFMTYAGSAQAFDTFSEMSGHCQESFAKKEDQTRCWHDVHWAHLAFKTERQIAKNLYDIIDGAFEEIEPMSETCESSRGLIIGKIELVIRGAPDYFRDVEQKHPVLNMVKEYRDFKDDHVDKLKAYRARVLRYKCGDRTRK